MKKVMFVNGSRGEWGYIKPVIDYCTRHEPDIQTMICATNMLLAKRYGNLLEEIKADGYNIVGEIAMALEGGTHYAMAKSLPIFQLTFTDLLQTYKPDWVILAGDRGEQLAAAVACAYMYIPVAHIQAGERSGNIDGVVRHAIGKLVHLHFSANEDATNRLKALGEEEFRIHQTGAPQLDELVTSTLPNINTLFSTLRLGDCRPYLLCVFHGVTNEYLKSSADVRECIEALDKFEHLKIWILPNNDASSELVRSVILETSNTNNRIFSNLRRADYLSLLRGCAALIGNSSSGLIEAPIYKTPVVNIGTRQLDRVRGDNVISCSCHSIEIDKAITKATSLEFRKSIQRMSSPYGNGDSSKRIIQILKNTKIDKRLLTKRLEK